MSAIDTIMFGSFSWFLLVAFIIICFTAVIIRKMLGVLMVPVCVLVGLEYLANDLGWHALIMWFTSVGIVLYIATKKGE